MNMAELVWIDLCSGLGGFSQAARDRGWRVIRIDNNPAYQPDYLADLENPADLRRLCRELPQAPAVISASPVCTEFTKTGLPATWAANRLYPPRPDTTLTSGCRQIIRELQARWWTIENVAASRKFLTPLLGPVYASVAGHIFWGRLPCLLPETVGHKWRLPPSSDRAAVRARIPYAIGETIARAVEARLITRSDRSANDPVR